MDIQEILDEYGFESQSGRIGFKSPGIKLVCDVLGIKYSNLSRTGKAALRGDMIEQFMGRTPPVSEYGENYLNK